MRTLILLITLSLSVFSQAGGMEQCKAVGEKATKVMQFRQNSEDLFAALEKYNDSKMVMSAFERPRYDSMKSLKAMVNGFRKRDYNALVIHHDEVAEKQRNEINLFKMKYIKTCLSK